MKKIKLKDLPVNIDSSNIPCNNSFGRLTEEEAAARILEESLKKKKDIIETYWKTENQHALEKSADSINFENKLILNRLYTLEKNFYIFLILLIIINLIAFSFLYFK